MVTTENAYDSALADRLRLCGDFVKYLRPVVRRIKQNANYTGTIGEVLGIVAPSTPVDPAGIKPVITLTAHIGFVRVRIQRKGAQSVKLFCRRNGQSEWTSLGRVLRASFDDTSALTQPGVPEIKEYMRRRSSATSRWVSPATSKSWSSPATSRPNWPRLVRQPSLTADRAGGRVRAFCFQMLFLVAADVRSLTIPARNDEIRASSRRRLR